jgi:hypothetical protein
MTIRSQLRQIELTEELRNLRARLKSSDVRSATAVFPFSLVTDVQWLDGNKVMYFMDKFNEPMHGILGNYFALGIQLQQSILLVDGNHRAQAAMIKGKKLLCHICRIT